MSDIKTINIGSQQYGKLENLQKELQYQSFVVIRQYVNDITSEANNDEIAGFVKGVCELERECYSMLQRETANILKSIE